MRSSRGFTLIELMVVLGVGGVLAGMALPVFIESSARNSVWTASETIGAQIRQARLKAVSRNSTFQVRFNCPVAGQFRVLVVDANINNANRCSTTVANDGGIYRMPNRVGYGTVNPLQVNGLGAFSSVGGAVPATITVTDGQRSRTLTVSVTGQVTFGSF